MERFATSLLGEAKTLLLATDGSPFSDGAIQEAIFFGQACRARIIVLHVVQSQAESIHSANFAIRQAQQECAPHLDQIRKMADDVGVQLEVVVVGSSKPEKTIVEQAQLRHADVILMGRQGKTGHLSRLVGKMTARVISQRFPRVLVAPKDFIITGNQILLAVDDSENSRQVILEALALGRTCVTLQGMTVMTVIKDENDRLQAQGLVDSVCEQARQDGLPIPCHTVVEVGDPAERIITVAQQRMVDMILLGSPGKAGMMKMLLGHVTENVIGRAHCAVLVISA
jgi:nucleotide-binding universal stress UspA family protein